VVRLARDRTAKFRHQAEEGLRTLAAGDLAKHLVLYTRQADEHEMPRVTRFCLTLGKGVIGTLIDGILAEENSRTIRRLREVLLSFGPAARAYVDELRKSSNPAVRRTAVELLRAFGGAEALPDLAALLDDAEPTVQREALRAIVQIGTDDAFATLEGALKTGAPHTRDAITHALIALRDERAAPLFIYIIRHADHRGPLEGVYCSALTGLGHVGGADPDVVTVLTAVLRRGEWWAPGRTRRIRAAAAEALRALDTPESLTALTQIAQGGPGGARRAARAALAVERASPVMRPS
jgi:HEAT repeat protein